LICKICNSTDHDARSCPERLCKICNSTGHDARSCPERRQNLICKICDTTGHDARSCPDRRSTVVCKVCNEVGHDGRSCPVRRANRELLSSLAELSSSSGSGESSGAKSDSDDEKINTRVDFYSVENSSNNSVQHCRTLVNGCMIGIVFNSNSFFDFIRPPSANASRLYGPRTLQALRQ
jgi:hypothetical protein